METLYAVDAATGEQEWTFTQPEDSVSSSPTVVDDTVYVGSGDETLYAVDTVTGEQEWAFTQPTGLIGSSPTVVDDPNNGDSIGSRVTLGTLGHHHEWAETASSDDPIDDDLDAVFTFDPDTPQAGETIEFTASDSEPTNEIDEYRWDFTDTGETDATGETVTHTFEDTGNHPVMLTVESGDSTDTSSEIIPVEAQTDERDDDTGVLPSDVDAYAIDAVRRNEGLGCSLSGVVGSERSLVADIYCDGAKRMSNRSRSLPKDPAASHPTRPLRKTVIRRIPQSNRKTTANP